MSNQPLRPGDIVLDSLSGEHREVSRLIMHATALRPIGYALKVPGKPDQFRSPAEVRLVEAGQRDLLAAQ